MTKLKNSSTFARTYRGRVVILLTISTSAELTLKLISKLSEGAVKRKNQSFGEGKKRLSFPKTMYLYYFFHLVYTGDKFIMCKEIL